MYTFAIHLYALIVSLISPFHRKAKLMRLGQKKTNSILRDKIEPGANYIWFHASSLGEFEQGRPLIEKIKSAHPEYKIILTFFSPSGYEVRKNYEGVDVICYLPFDKPSNVRVFLDLVNPVMVFFIKYEFWANYLKELKRRKIPTYIIAAIFRKDQLFFKWYGKSYRQVLTCFNHLFVQDKRSANLLAEYGIRNVTVAGDTRFDRVLEVQKRAKGIPLVAQFVKNKTEEKQTTLVAGSSWPQDEEIIIPYFNAHPELKLIIAPHEIHESHLAAIEAQLKRPFIRLSQANEQNVSGKDCLIIDCFGLLSSIYRYGEVAYIGGGFGTGIHNILEAAVYGMPVIFGPKFQKFKEARGLIKAGGGFSIADKTTFADKMSELFAYQELLDGVGESAKTFVQRNAGATGIILSQINSVLLKT